MTHIMKTIIKNIKEIISASKHNKNNPKKGAEMNKIQSLKDGWISISEGKIEDFGTMKEWNGVENWNETTIIDANQGYILPAWCDSHTHCVYAGSRESEFVDRIKGLSYEDIAKNGGGILNSAILLSKTSEKELYLQSSKRVDQIIKYGTGGLEIKSGYGLNTKNEIKMLRVIKQLKENFPIPIKSTFLGAHAVPKGYTKSNYIKSIINEMIPEIHKQGLADYIDVFCDKGFFTAKETEKILTVAAKYDLKSKIHANELAFSGGIEVGVKMGSISVDHLEYTDESQINLLLNSNTMPTLLPGTAFFLGLDYPPARHMIDMGLPIALASDFNPGSFPSGNMAFILSLACIKMKMKPMEAISAATINGAFAMEMNQELGSIEQGKRANLIITKEIPSLNYIPYSINENNISKVLINGQIYYNYDSE